MDQRPAVMTQTLAGFLASRQPAHFRRLHEIVSALEADKPSAETAEALVQLHQADAAACREAQRLAS